jgi:hypothetical protein
MRTRGGLIGIAVAAALAISGCGGAANADPCVELDKLTAENDPGALVADAEDPDGLFAQCIEKAAEQWGEMSPEEQEAFLNR